LSAVIGGFCGQNLGAGAYARLQQSLRWSLRYALSIGALLAMLLYIGAPWLVAAFTSEPASAAVAVSYLRIVPLSYGCYGLVMAANASFNGLGRPLPATVISVARVIGFYLPVAWLLQQQFGIDGLFYASASANIAVGLLAYGWLRHYYRNLAASAE
jgi:Na+-driven multidrug efflux pump